MPAPPTCARTATTGPATSTSARTASPVATTSRAWSSASRAFAFYRPLYFYCRCSINLTGEDCRKIVQTDYDFFFSDETRWASASLSVPFALGSSSLILALWVQFTHRDDIGNIATLYSVDSSSTRPNQRIMTQMHSSGVHIALLAGIKDVFLPFRVNLAINDGQWQHIALVWDGPNGATLTTDGAIVGRVENYGVNRTLSQLRWIALGAPNSAAKLDRRTTDSTGI